MPKKIKILFQLNELGVGGTTKAIQSFCENINRDKFDPYLFYYWNNSKVTFLRKKIQSFFSLKEQSRFRLTYFENLARLPDFEKTLGKDKIYCGQLSDFLGVIDKIKPQIVHVNRGDEVDFYTESVDQIPTHIKLVETSVFGVGANPQYLNRISHFYFVSEWLKAKAHWCDPQKALVLYNPINLPATKDDLRKQLNIPDKAFVVGRIIRPNSDDCKFVIDAFKTMATEDCYFVMIGASDLFMHESKKNPKMIFLPATADEIQISKFYNTLDVLLHWRQQGESFGMNIVEAMIHGKPVVSHQSTFNNAQVEILDQNDFGPVGVVAGVDDLQGYVQGILGLKNNVALRGIMSANAQKKALTLFQASVITQRLEKFYSKLF